MMEILKVTAEEYKLNFPLPKIIYNSVEFSELNKQKMQDVHYLLFRNSKLRFGMVLGECETKYLCPFSSPFGMLINNKKQRIEFYEEAVCALKSYAESNNKSLRFVLPPYIYGEDVNKFFLALMRSNAHLLYTDANYHYDLSHFSHYVDNLERNAKKNFTNARKVNFDFYHLDSTNRNDVGRAYAIIKENRASRGYPLRMSLNAIWDTIQIIPADFFVMTYEGVDVAAAQVFHVTSKICQVIYWGDISAYAHLRVMNYFSYKLFEYYYNIGIQILDIGPSTEYGIPNYGLCEFKESIGCDVSLKYSIEL